jgi:hypothetical protein
MAKAASAKPRSTTHLNQPNGFGPKFLPEPSLRLAHEMLLFSFRRALHFPKASPLAAPAKSWRIGASTTTRIDRMGQSATSPRLPSRLTPAHPARRCNKGRKSLPSGGPTMGSRSKPAEALIAAGWRFSGRSPGRKICQLTQSIIARSPKACECLRQGGGPERS